jgi:hypothetical protein
MLSGSAAEDVVNHAQCPIWTMGKIESLLILMNREQRKLTVIYHLLADAFLEQAVKEGVHPGYQNQ